MMLERDHIDPPPVSFYFNVHFIGPNGIPDIPFMEVSGLTMELETEEIDYGGGNKRTAPKQQKHGNLICKRPIKPIGMSALSGWMVRSLQGSVDQNIITSDIVVTLLSSIGAPQCGWYLSTAYPVKWTIAEFNSQKNEIALETFEFAYDSLNRVL